MLMDPKFAAHLCSLRPLLSAIVFVFVNFTTSPRWAWNHSDPMVRDWTVVVRVTHARVVLVVLAHAIWLEVTGPNDGQIS